MWAMWVNKVYPHSTPLNSKEHSYILTETSEGLSKLTDAQSITRIVSIRFFPQLSFSRFEQAFLATFEPSLFAFEEKNLKTVQPVKFAPLMIQGLECLKENTQCLGREVFLFGWSSIGIVFWEFISGSQDLLFFTAEVCPFCWFNSVITHHLCKDWLNIHIKSLKVLGELYQSTHGVFFGESSL